MHSKTLELILAIAVMAVIGLIISLVLHPLYVRRSWDKYSQTRSNAKSTQPSSRAGQQQAGEDKEELKNNFILDVSGIAATLLLVLVTAFLVYFARSSDRAYHRIMDIAAELTHITKEQAGISEKQTGIFAELAKIAKEQADISRRQLQILPAQDEPIFRARIETATSDAGIADKDRLIVDNAG
jgi:hypothetical protein